MFKEDIIISHLDAALNKLDRFIALWEKVELSGPTNYFGCGTVTIVPNEIRMHIEKALAQFDAKDQKTLIAIDLGPDR